MNDSEQHTGIEISVETRFLSQQSDPKSNSFAFSYTITIANHRDDPVTLLERHWVITDQNGHIEEVKGKGVIGKQPLIEPGTHFRYSSGAVISTEIGDMTGHYTMKTSTGELFSTPIPTFILALPHKLH